ncbi:MAG: glycosyltransferase [Clostridia bacterium]|nr:glycosyltransferase [Clostridia bacterium]
MKIGLFVDAFFPMIDGVINVVDCYATELSRRAEVTVFCPKAKGEKKSSPLVKPYKIVRCRSFSIPRFDYAVPTPSLDRKFIRLLKKYKLDVVHAHSPFGICHKAKKYAKKHGIPLIGTIHSQYKHDFERNLKLRLPINLATSYVVAFYNSCDECWTVNEGMKSIYQNGLGISKPCLVMPNATDHLPIENKRDTDRQINSLYGINDSTVVFLFVGRLTFQKNVDLIVRALKILKEKGIDFKMLFVGTGQDEMKLFKMISDSGLLKEVVICGKITDKNLLQMLYARAKLLLFPSLYDASSLVQIESACQKTPTLFLEGATTSCGIIKDKNGFLAKNSPFYYAEEILRILSDGELYNRVSEGAFNDLYLTWEQVIEKVYAGYERLIEENAKKQRKEKDRIFSLRKG